MTLSSIAVSLFLGAHLQAAITCMGFQLPNCGGIETGLNVCYTAKSLIL